MKTPPAQRAVDPRHRTILHFDVQWSRPRFLQSNVVGFSPLERLFRERGCFSVRRRALSSRPAQRRLGHVARRQDRRCIRRVLVRTCSPCAATPPGSAARRRDRAGRIVPGRDDPSSRCPAVLVSSDVGRVPPLFRMSVHAAPAQFGPECLFVPWRRRDCNRQGRQKAHQTNSER